MTLDIRGLFKMKEEWKTCEGFSDYEVSNLGNIRAKGSTYVRLYTKTSKGYYITLPSDENKSKTTKPSRLIAKAFVPFPDELKSLRPGQIVVAFKDNDIYNVKPDNLYWAQKHNKNYVEPKRVPEPIVVKEVVDIKPTESRIYFDDKQFKYVLETKRGNLVFNRCYDSIQEAFAQKN